MPDSPFNYCKLCGGLFVPDKLSKRGMCRHCSAERVATARLQILRREGPIYNKWSLNVTAGNQKRRKDK